MCGANQFWSELQFNILIFQWKSKLQGQKILFLISWRNRFVHYRRRRILDEWFPDLEPLQACFPGGCCFQICSGKPDMNGAPERVLMWEVESPSSSRGWPEQQSTGTAQQPGAGSSSSCLRVWRATQQAANSEKKIGNYCSAKVSPFVNTTLQEISQP